MAISMEVGLLSESERFELRRVLPEQIPIHWPTIEVLLQRQPGLWNQLWTLEAIEQNLASGGFQLWIAYVDDRHFLFTFSMVVTYPSCRILRFWWASGNGIEDYMWALVDEMNNVAKELGCSHMEMEVGRKGWGPKMKQFGVRFSREILRREVMDSRRQ